MTTDEPAELYVLDEPARLLVADDDPILREFACVHLAAPHVTVEAAADGAEALASLAAKGFDLALVDLDMPNVDGFEVIRRVRADPRHAHLPIIVVTGREDMEAIDRAFRHGATSFVVKPINWRLLSYQIRYVLRTSRQGDEVRQARHRAEEALALRTHLLRMVQHELRTPLAAILAEAAELRAGKLPARAVAETIERESRTFLDKVTDLVASARVLTGETDLHTDDWPLSALLSAVVQAERVQAEARGVALRVRKCPDLTVEVDRDRLSLAVRRLVRNAIVHGAGDVDLYALLEADGRLAIAVRDEGAGPPLEVAERCLQGFGASDLHRSSGGFGLGLPLARIVAEAHGGALSLAAAPGIGCVATLRLPAERVLQPALSPAGLSTAPSASASRA